VEEEEMEQQQLQTNSVSSPQIVQESNMQDTTMQVDPDGWETVSRKGKKKQ
jgi:hypothetical protein